MRFYQIGYGAQVKLVGWQIGPFKFGVAKKIQVEPIHIMKGRWAGSVVFILRNKPYSLESLEQMRWNLEATAGSIAGGATCPDKGPKGGRD